MDEQIKDNIKHLQSLINQVRAISLIEAIKCLLHPSKHDKGCTP